MLPMQSIRLSIGTLLANAAPLNQVTALNRVALVKAPIALSENLTLADLTLADFDGSTELTVALGAQQVGLNPLTGEQEITVPGIVGGWRWITTGVTNLPQTIYGYCLYDSTGPGPLLAVGVLDTPIPLIAIGQEIILPELQLIINQTPIS
jgi:hypothetical protein